ncbi:PilZ domain-containing protein [Pontixanthobacter sp.]|uniref:PilZ domain-containing protein n=1 Tax=Pontixanthobacter sp. TaxID=2792078 RepID=UPI003C7AE48A
MLLETDQSYIQAAQEDRCAPRTRLAIPAQLRPSGSRSRSSMVHDLSLSGFSASAISRMHPGQICWLTLPTLEPLQAEVIWWDRSQVGCAFTDLLSPIVHDNILALYNQDRSHRRAV